MITSEEIASDRRRLSAKVRKRAVEQWLLQTERKIAGMEAALPRLRRKKAELEGILARVNAEIAATKA